MTALRRWIPLFALGAMAWSVCAEPLQLRIEREPDARLTRLPVKTPAFGAADTCTSLLAWWLFDESLGAGVLAGLALSAVGVGLVLREPRRP